MGTLERSVTASTRRLVSKKAKSQRCPSPPLLSLQMYGRSASHHSTEHLVHGISRGGGGDPREMSVTMSRVMSRPLQVPPRM